MRGDQARLMHHPASNLNRQVAPTSREVQSMANGHASGLATVRVYTDVNE